MTDAATRNPSARKLTNAIKRGLYHPTWLRETVRGKVRARADRNRRFSLEDHAEYVLDVHEAIEAHYGVGATEYESLRSRVRIPPRRQDLPWSGGEHVLTLIGVIALLTRPQTVLETGVAAGFTTAVLLAALEDNGQGQLHSIDLPPLQVDPSGFIGQVVPEELRARWSLHVGPSQTVLPALAPAIAPIDVFLHDADHSYAGQYGDFREVWPHLSKDGALISDDVSNPAFLDFAKEVGARPHLVASGGAKAAVGFLVKSG